MTILFEKSEDGIARIILNRPDVHNALNAQMIADLTAAFHDLANCPNTKILLLSGAGASFTAGADLKWMKQAAGYSEEENFQDAMKLSDMLDALYNLPQLTITCVQGANMGGAIGLISCSDIVYADEQSKFSLSEVTLGLIPATISPYVINAIGGRHAKRYSQTGERFGCERALEIGLIHEVYTSFEDLQSKVESLLFTLRSNAPGAMKKAKKLAIDYNDLPISDDIRRDSAKRIAAARASVEAAKGLKAFLSKKKPDWTKDV